MELNALYRAERGFDFERRFISLGDELRKLSEAESLLSFALEHENVTYELLCRNEG